MSRKLTNDEGALLVRAGRAAKRGDCGTALDTLKRVRKTALNPEDAAWRQRVDVLARRCLRTVGLFGANRRSTRAAAARRARR